MWLQETRRAPAPACWRARRIPLGGACRPWPGPGVRVRPAGQKCREREFCSTAFPLGATPDSRRLVFGMGPPVARVDCHSPLPVCCPRGTQLRGSLRLAGRCAPVVLLWGQEGQLWPAGNIRRPARSTRPGVGSGRGVGAWAPSGPGQQNAPVVCVAAAIRRLCRRKQVSMRRVCPVFLLPGDGAALSAGGWAWALGPPAPTLVYSIP